MILINSNKEIIQMISYLKNKLEIFHKEKFILIHFKISIIKINFLI